MRNNFACKYYLRIFVQFFFPHKVFSYIWVLYIYEKSFYRKLLKGSPLYDTHILYVYSTVSLPPFFMEKNSFHNFDRLFFHKPDERNVERRENRRSYTLRMLVARKLLLHIPLIRTILLLLFFFFFFDIVGQKLVEIFQDDRGSSCF